jgi:hypothetical protein
MLAMDSFHQPRPQAIAIDPIPENPIPENPIVD